MTIMAHPITATYVNYYSICKRKLYLHANGITMEYSSDIVYDGKLLHEVSYPQRAEQRREVELRVEWKNFCLSAKIDYYDAMEKVIHETKRSDKMEESHEWQLKYYIWLFELSGISGVMGVLEYPKLRLKTQVVLLDEDIQQLEVMIPHIQDLIASDACPPTLHAKICKGCSYFDFCYAGE